LRSSAICFSSAFWMSSMWGLSDFDTSAIRRSFGLQTSGERRRQGLVPAIPAVVSTGTAHGAAIKWRGAIPGTVSTLPARCG